MTCYKTSPFHMAPLPNLRSPSWMFTNSGTKRANVQSNLETSSSLGCGCEKGSQSPDAQPVTQWTGWTLPQECPVRGPTGFVPTFSSTPRTQACPPPAKFRWFLEGCLPRFSFWLSHPPSVRLSLCVSLNLSLRLSPAVPVSVSLTLYVSLCFSFILFPSWFFPGPSQLKSFPPLHPIPRPCPSAPWLRARRKPDSRLEPGPEQPWTSPDAPAPAGCPGLSSTSYGTRGSRSLTAEKGRCQGVGGQLKRKGLLSRGSLGGSGEAPWIREDLRTFREEGLRGRVRLPRGEGAPLGGQRLSVVRPASSLLAPPLSLSPWPAHLHLK